MPGLAEPQGKNGDLYTEDEPDDLDELVTRVLRVEEAEDQDLPPTTVGSLEESGPVTRPRKTREAEPLVFYVEDKTQGRLRVAAVVLFGLLLSLLVAGNWLYAWEPGASPSMAGADHARTNGEVTTVVPVPVDSARPATGLSQDRDRRNARAWNRGLAPATAAEGVTERIARSAARYGEVDVSSSPLGAEVFLDGYRVGRTPLRGLRLPAGSYRLELRRQGQIRPVELQVRAFERTKATAQF